MKPLSLSQLFVFLILHSTVLSLHAIEEHSVIKPMPRSEPVPAQCRVKNYASHDFKIQKANSKKLETVTKKGKYWHFRYFIKDAAGKTDRNVSREEIVQNYKQAALEKGGTIHYEAVYLLTFSLDRQDGGKTWAFLSANNGVYNLDIIDEAAFKKQLTFGAEEMKRKLDEEGRVAVYGIYFDIDKKSLKLGAEKVLIEMVKLMKNNPALHIEIQGHTDDTGSAQHNKELSGRRAGTVKQFLIAYGIADSRMKTTGYGEDKPVAPNDSEENRALNRRVELAKLN
jgi:outer membrane protein OmpA-like peptidoglycan-associated protein